MEVATVNEYLTAACFLIIRFLLLFPQYKVKEKYARKLFPLKAEQTYLFLLFKQKHTMSLIHFIYTGQIASCTSNDRNSIWWMEITDRVA